MQMRYRFAAALMAATLVTGCGGAVPDTTAPVSAPTAAPAPQSVTESKSAQPTTPAGAQPAPTTAPAVAPTPAAQPEAPAPKAPDAPVTIEPVTKAPAAPVTAAPEPAVQALSFTTLQRGAYSGVTDRRAVLVTDAAQWQTNWQQTNARLVPVPPAPAMDFSDKSVLAVYMGEQNTGGYAIEITGVQLQGETLKVTVKQTRPGPGTIVTQALTQPFHMIQIPKVPAATTVQVNWQ